MRKVVGGQSHHLFLEQELVIRAGSLHSVLRCFFFSPAFFFLRVGGSEGVYIEGREEQGLEAVRALKGNLLLFSELGRELEFVPWKNTRG